MLVLGFLLPAPVRAHPHAWIDARATLRFTAGSLASIRLRWKLDELVSDYVRHEFDKDGDGRLDAAETARVEAEAFAALEEFGFLSHLRVDGALTPLGKPRSFTASLEGAAVVYDFELPLTALVDPRRHAVALSLFDETYYIDIGFEVADPVSVEGDAPPGCTASIEDDVKHPIYFGMVYPKTARLRCPAA